MNPKFNGLNVTISKGFKSFSLFVGFDNIGKGVRKRLTSLTLQGVEKFDIFFMLTYVNFEIVIGTFIHIIQKRSMKPMCN